MKSNSLLVLACLLSSPVFAQSLPDEINYGPYQTRYQSLERETAKAAEVLAASRHSLSEAQRFIREMTEHIAVLQREISDNQNEIARLRREIPELERMIVNLRNEDSRVMQDMRSRQIEESQLVGRYQSAERDLRPLEQALSTREMRVREIQSQLAQFQRNERDAANRLTAAQNNNTRLANQIVDSKNNVRKMQEELRSIESRISSVQSQISILESNRGTLQSNINMERAKLSSLTSRVAEGEAEVARLRSSGAPAAEIANAERRVQAARSTRDNTAQEIRNLESQISRTESQIRTNRSQVDELRRNQSALPSRISAEENRTRQLESQRNQALSEIQRYTVELQAARTNVATRTDMLNREQNELRVAQQNVMRQRQLMENLSRDINSVRSEISSLSQRSRNLNSQIAQATQTIRSHETAIPQLEKEIRTAQSEISQGERDLVTARNDERTFSAKVTKDEATLADLTSRRNSAEVEMNQRISLYNTYLGEAEELGKGQAASGTQLGIKEGQRLSSVLSRQNGTSAGKEMGLLEARHWGSVRGEIEGFDIGYQDGLASAEDISRATSEASYRASVDAELFAQKNFKPVFFEEYVQEEFKRPDTLKALTHKLSSVKMNFLELDARETVLPLSEAEISRSQNLATPLDASITQVVKDIKAAEAKIKRLSDPEVAFEAPSKIPAGTPDCSRVYKGLAVFKASCEGSYKGAFTNNYVTAARDSFSETYHQEFTVVYNQVNVAERESAFTKEYSQAQAIGKAEGLRIGKVEIYQTTFERVYKTAYASELEKARIKAKRDAEVELSSFLKTKPLLTVASTSLAAENFRGGEEVVIKGKVRNVGQGALQGPVMVKITSVENAEKIIGDVVLNSAGPLSTTDLPELKVRVLPTSRAGDRIVIKGTVDMPGDLYKTSRQETFELVQTLAANPANDISLDYNKTPNIKGPFSRYIHFVSVKIAPKIEDIKDGYTVTVLPTVEAAPLMDMKNTELSTGSLSVNSQKELRFSYVFKDQAKGKTLNLEVSVSYQGKVIRKESITVTPK